MSERLGLNVSAKLFEEESMPLSLDLVAVFSLMKEDIMETIQKALEEGKTPTEIISILGDKI